jgi:hypothetical protein
VPAFSIFTSSKAEATPNAVADMVPERSFVNVMRPLPNMAALFAPVL